MKYNIGDKIRILTKSEKLEQNITQDEYDCFIDRLENWNKKIGKECGIITEVRFNYSLGYLFFINGYCLLLEKDFEVVEESKGGLFPSNKKYIN